MIENVLKNKPGGDRIINEYAQTKSLTDSRRRDMVKILVAHMTSEHGYVENFCCTSHIYFSKGVFYTFNSVHNLCLCRTSPPRRVKEDYAKGIITLFPYLADPRSRFGYVSLKK